MTTSRISWERVVNLCPKESASLVELLDKYDLRLNELLRGVTRAKAWHDVVGLRSCHMKVTELEEPKVEACMIHQLQAAWDAFNQLKDAWDALTSAFESATDQGGLCHRIAAIVFENEFEVDEMIFFEVELARPKRC